MEGLMILFGIIIVTTVFSMKTDLTVEEYSFSGRDETSIMESQVKLRKFNKTTQVINGTYEFLLDISDDFKLSVDAWQYQGREFKKMQFRSPPIGYCTLRKNDKYVWPDLESHMNVPKGCPVPKGIYYVNNFALDERKIPPFFNGKFKLIGYFKGPNGKQSNTTLIATFHSYTTLG